jgi:hypothetical protein
MIWRNPSKVIDKQGTLLRIHEATEPRREELDVARLARQEDGVLGLEIFEEAEAKTHEGQLLIDPRTGVLLGIVLAVARHVNLFSLRGTNRLAGGDHGRRMKRRGATARLRGRSGLRV